MILGVTWPSIRISLEKPTAVVFADAPMVEMVRSSDPNVDKESEALRRLSTGDKVQVPYPLQGRLDNWIRSNHLEEDGL